ncbi:MAG TPA: hypothetical protein VFH01_13935 [Pyrinomonadaceae bacterium]|nr:hypothetical protein [Pyrinomonadaceae bacterium]
MRNKPRSIGSDHASNTVSRVATTGRRYTQAKARAKREAQQRIVEMMFPEEGLARDVRLQRGQPNELLGGDGLKQEPKSGGHSEMA